MIDAPPVTAANWRTHPAIVEVRRLYDTVRPLVRGVTHVVGCPDGTSLTGGDVRSGGLRSLSYGSDDSAVTITVLFDAARVRRFVLVEAGAVNGTKDEYRYYFDAKGRRLWRDVRRTGPGYTFSPELFEKQFGPDFARLPSAC